MNKTSSVLVRTLLLGSTCLSVVNIGAALADPTGGTVVTGTATIASHGNSTTINQSTNRALINWDSFSIAAGGQVRFNQPGSGSITLNRVIGSAPSSIYGSILANGQVWLINSNGILFGRGAQVNVGGLLATTSNIADRDFADGNFNFSGGSGASVVNQGTIRARNGGSVVMSGASVQNQGLIQADAGTVVLGGASAFTVDFDGDNLLRYAIAAPAGAADNGQTGVSNSGTIQANNGGHVIMTARAAADIAGAVINNTGIISATSAKVQNGEVVLDGGDGDVNVSGTINATGTGAARTGGFVSVAGRNITVADNTQINVSGDAGGGTVHIGGDVHGGGTMAHAANVTVGRATIKADATRKGDGGTLVVWSNGLTDFSGIFSAIGGAAGGNGGFVETSGHHLKVGDDARVDTTASRGATGTWLLDPDYINIVDDGITGIGDGGVVAVGDDSGSEDFIAPSTITTALQTTNVRLEAAQDITVYDRIHYDSTHSLSLLAEHDIYIAADVQNEGTGAINVVAGWDGETIDPSHFTDDGVYGNNDGSVYVTSDYDLDPEEDPAAVAAHGEAHAVAIGSAGGTTTVAGSDVQVLGYFGASQIGHLGGAGGDIVVRATGDVVLDSINGFDAIIGNGGAGATSDVTGNIDVRATGALQTWGGESEALNWIGNLSGGDFGAAGNVTLVAGTAYGDTDFGHVIAADLAGGDFTLGFSDDDLYAGGLIYNSSHTLNLLASGNLYLPATIANSGSGAINLVAGWDAETLDPAHFGDDGVYGNNLGIVGIGGPDADGDVAIGSAHGAVNVYTDTLIMEADYGNVQLGYHGAGGGDINVLATSDVVLSAQDIEDGTYSVMIGNGALDGSVGGQITGNIFIKAQGLLLLDVYTGEGDCGCGFGGEGRNAPGDGGNLNQDIPRLLGIGNASGLDSPAATGDVTIISSEVDDEDSGAFGQIILADLGYGNVTIGSLDSNIEISDDLSYDSAFTLSLLSEDDIDISANLQNAGSGAINLIAGWDGETLDPTHFGDDGVYGNFGGTINIGGTDAEGDVSVGSAFGAVNVFADTLYMEADYGNVQLGYHGAGGGDINVLTTGDVELSAIDVDDATYSVMIGNGALDGSVEGAITGNIFIKAQGSVILDVFTGEDCGIDCGGFRGPPGDGGSVNFPGPRLLGIGNAPGIGEEPATGNVTIISSDVDDEGSGTFGQIVADDLDYGDVTIGHLGDESAMEIDGLNDYDSTHTLNLLSVGDIVVDGSVQNSGSGAINLVAGWDGQTLDPEQFGEDGVYGNNAGTITIGGEDADDDVSVGSAQGLLSLYADNLVLDAVNGIAQAGYRGEGGGDILVRVVDNLSLHAHDEFGALIGNGSRDGDVTGDVGGNIDIRAQNGVTSLISSADARAWIGNSTGGGGKAHGDIRFVTDFGGLPSDMIAADLGTSEDTGGNFFLGFVDANDGSVGIAGMTYNSPHELTIASAANMVINGSVQNGGTGAITLVAGWDEQTYGSAADLTDAHAYGLHNATLIVGNGASAAVGSAGGLTTILTDNLSLLAGGGYAQIGYHGAGTGNISIAADGDVTLTGGAAPANFAMIGNGSLNGGFSGNVGGDIEVHAAGTTTLNQTEGGGADWIGNVAAGGFSATGNVLYVTGLFHSDASVASMVASDLAGGDVTIGITDAAADNEIDGPFLYNSSHVLTLLTAGSLTVASTVQNAGSGAINVVTGWDGTTFNAAHFGDAGVYGNNGGSLTVGGQNAAGNAAIGGKGTTSLYTANATVSAVFGYAQLGYHGAGGGAVNVTANGSVSVFTNGNALMALIGNGGTDVAGTIGGAVNVSSQGAVLLTANYQNSIAAIGNVGGGNSSLSGNVTVDSHGAELTLSSFSFQSHTQIGNWNKGNTTGTISGDVHVDAGAVSLIASTNGYGQIGNGTLRFSNVLGDISGDIVIHAASFTGSAASGSQVRVGNLGSANASGDISLITTGNVSLTGSGGLLNIGVVSAAIDGDGNPAQGHAVSNLLIQSGGTLTMSSFASGSVRIETGGAVGGSIHVTAAGDITMQAGATGIPGSNSLVLIGSLMAGNGGTEITVTSTGGGVYLTASETGGQARIGNQQNGQLGGTMGGTVTVTAANLVNGNISLSATGANSLARIGNAGFEGATVGGDISIVAGNALTFGACNILIGNSNENPQDGGDPVPAPFAGNVTFSAWSVSGNAAGSIAHDLGGGNVLLKVFGPSFTLGGPVAYSSSHALSILAAGNIILANSVQNGGSGAINLVAGWDRATLDPAHFFDPGHFANNGGTLTVGGGTASGNVAVGSFGGTTNAGGAGVSLLGVNGYAQLGYHGATGGAINVRATGALVLTGASAANWAMLGNGQTFAAKAGGDVAVTAGSIQSGGNSAAAGNNLSLTVIGGDIGGQSAALRVDSSTLAVSTFGGAVFLTSPNSAVVLAGVNTGGGSFSLGAGGAITQSTAIHTGQANLSTTSGDITLTNAGNAFGGMTIATAGNASLRHASLLTIASAHIGGTLTLTAGGAINQSGAIVAGALDASSGVGGADQSGLNQAALSGITLTNSGNSFGTLTVHTANGQDATVVDSTAVAVAGASVAGGTFKLSAGGAITQSGAIVADTLDVSTTSGAITLTNAANQFGGLKVQTQGSDSASLVDSLGVVVKGANTGGNLTLATGGGITQTGAIHATALTVSTLTGGIALTNSGNSFATLSVTTHGSDNASITDSTGLTVASADVGGTLTLNAGGAMGQSGAIHAAGLNVSTVTGAITFANGGNAFGPLAVVTHGSDNATFNHASLLTVASANVGGTLTLTGGTGINQSGAIVAASLNATATAGNIVLTNAGNSFAALTVHTATGANDATITDSTGVTIAGATVGGGLTLSAGGAVGQSSAILAQRLSVSTTTGAITLTGLTNAVSGTVQFNTPGAASFYNTTAMNVGATLVGGDLTLLSKGNINFRNSVQSTSGNITVVAGWDGVTTNAAAFGNAGVYGNNSGPGTGNIVIGGTGAAGAVFVGSKSGTTSLYANNVVVAGNIGAAQLGYHGAGGGAILVRALHDVGVNATTFSAMIGNGSLTSDVSGNITGDIDVRAGGNLNFTGTAQTWFGNMAHAGTETGNLIVVANDVNDNSDHQFGTYLTAAIQGGDITVGFTGSDDQGPDNAIAYNSSHTLNILTVGNFVITGSIQNAGTGAINVVAGWDGHTIAPASYGTAGVYGNNGKGVLIGGSGAAGNSALGSAGGATSIYAASLQLSAVHGYAQLGYNGHGSGAILVKTTGGVSLTGGADAGQFAQIGNGGKGTSGNNSGDIVISAGGDLTLTGGAGAESYAQLGHGGAESNTGANGYSNVAAITVTAANVLLNAGGGNAAYVQIGNGGYKAGLNLASGNGNNGGAITITSGHAVSLTGNGADAYAQIGNGGSLSNSGAAAAAGGSDFGDIVVHAPNGAAGSVTLTAGAGANAYSQIGNGGYAVNSGPTTTVANFTITGNVTVTDLALSGGNGGPNAYAQIGNGDASHNATGNISGNITIDANGQITYTNGTAAHSQATIGNFTGQGTVSGTLSGANPPAEPGTKPPVTTDPVVIGVVVNNTAGNDSPTDHNNGITTIQTLVIQEEQPGGNSAVTLEHATPGPLASLEGGSGEDANDADSATVVIADSLDGGKKAGATTILSGMLKAAAPAGSAVGAVPPADQDFSSWGNEALWQ